MGELEFIKKNYKQAQELIFKSYQIFLRVIKKREILLEVNNQNNLGVNDNVQLNQELMLPPEAV